MAHVELQPVIKSDMVCVKCVPPQPQGVCTCNNPCYIPEKDWLHITPKGRRDWPDKYGDKLKHSLEVDWLTNAGIPIENW